MNTDIADRSCFSGLKENSHFNIYYLVIITYRFNYIRAIFKIAFIILFFQVAALADLSRVEQVIPLLKHVLTEDIPIDKKQTFNKEVIERFQVSVSKLDNNDIVLEVNRLINLLEKQGNIIDVVSAKNGMITYLKCLLLILSTFSMTSEKLHFIKLTINYSCSITYFILCVVSGTFVITTV